MNKRKWKKLSKRFACALALAMLMSVNPAWAMVEDNGETLTITNETVTSDKPILDGKEYDFLEF